MAWVGKKAQVKPCGTGQNQGDFLNFQNAKSFVRIVTGKNQLPNAEITTTVTIFTIGGIAGVRFAEPLTPKCGEGKERAGNS
jgi:hypothetical protein